MAVTYDQRMLFLKYFKFSSFLWFNFYSSSSSALELLIPKKRSLFSWLQLSQGDRNVLSTHIMIQGLDTSKYNQYNQYQRPMYEYETPQEASECINVN